MGSPFHFFHGFLRLALETIYGKLKFSTLARFGNLKVLMPQDKNTLEKRPVSHIVVKIASLSCWKVFIVIMEWIVIYLPKSTIQKETGRFANALGRFANDKKLKWMPPDLLSQTTAYRSQRSNRNSWEKKYLNPFLRKISFVWIIISVWIFCWLCSCLTHSKEVCELNIERLRIDPTRLRTDRWRNDRHSSSIQA